MSDALIVKTATTPGSIRERRGDAESWIHAGLGVDAARLRVANVYEGEGLQGSHRRLRSG